MKVYSLPPETAALIQNLQTDLRLWVLRLVAWLAVIFPCRWTRLQVQAAIRDARQDLRFLIGAKIVQRRRVRRVTNRSRAAEPAAFSAPPGFRLQRKRTNTLRLITRGISLRTLRDIRDVIENIDAVVTRALKRIPNTFLTHTLVAVIVPARELAACAPAPVKEAADTS